MAYNDMSHSTVSYKVLLREARCVIIMFHSVEMAR